MSRPLECNSCKKSICVFYKEISGENITCTEMCKECPVLEKKLQHETLTDQHTQELSCHHCHTSFSAIRTGNLLGCPDCYNAFEEQLVQELIKQDRVAPAACEARAAQPKAPLHRGKGPKHSGEVALPQRLQGLNQALNDAVGKEHFEEAAYLRDQIKDLMKGENE